MSSLARVEESAHQELWHQSGQVTRSQEEIDLRQGAGEILSMPLHQTSHRHQRIQ
jgi:hypothetical protein